MKKLVALWSMVKKLNPISFLFGCSLSVGIMTLYFYFFVHHPNMVGPISGWGSAFAAIVALWYSIGFKKPNLTVKPVASRHLSNQSPVIVFETEIVNSGDRHDFIKSFSIECNGKKTKSFSIDKVIKERESIYLNYQENISQQTWLVYSNPDYKTSKDDPHKIPTPMTDFHQEMEKQMRGNEPICVIFRFKFEKSKAVKKEISF